MQDRAKTKDQLIEELKHLRQRLTVLGEAEAGLKQAEQSFMTMFDHIDLGVTLIDSNHNVVMVNTAFAMRLGKSPAEFVGKKCFREFEGQEAVCRHCPGVQATAAGQAREAEVEVTEPNGTRVIVRIQAFPTFGTDGSATGFIEIVEDVTQRRMALQALQKTEERLELALNAADVGLWEWDLRTGLLTWSKRAHEMLGYSPDEVQDFSTFKAAVHPDDWPTVSEVLNGHIQGRLPSFKVEYRVRCKSGDWKWILGQGKIVERDSEGRPVFMTGSNLDVTERKLAEEERENLRAQLLQAQKMEAIGILAGGVAHDFNNLLTVIQGYSELLLSEDDVKGQVKSDLKKINHAARSGADLVRRLLMFSRKSEMKPCPMNLNQEILHSESLLSRTIPKTVRVSLRLEKELPTIEADPIQMEQVIMNLAVNAKDAMPNGGTLTIETKCFTLIDQCSSGLVGAKPGNYVLLIVSDTGGGIDEETLEHVFEPFFTTKSLGRGTGLGLAVVYGVVKQHGGHITCYSAPGEGTTFKVYFPSADSGIGSRGGHEEPYRPGGTETILLVDDEDFVRELGKRILSRAGYTVLTAVDGREALEVYAREKERISLVVLDLIMPEMDGKQCLRKILQIDPQAKVIISSGHSAEALSNPTAAAKPRGFVGKPYDVKRLLKTVREVLDQK